MSQEVIREYMDNIETEIADIPPHRIFNYDETNILDNPGKFFLILPNLTYYLISKPSGEVGTLL